MNHLFMRLVVLSAFIFLTLHSFASANAKSDTVVIKTNIYCDHYMKCESCKGRLVDMLMNEKGIKNVLLDVEKMTVTVVYNAKRTTQQAISKHISDLGFDADDLNANPDSYSELDGCCKKE